MALKLQQGQVWQRGEELIRIVHLERLEVRYKSFVPLHPEEGTHHQVSKKEFCRLLKGCSLLGVKPAAPASPPTPDK